MKKTDLPLSPHLQIYKPQITSILSIGHRLSGFFLNFFLLFLSLWVSSLALGEFYYNLFLEFSSFFLIKSVLSLGLLGFTYHALNGIRHIFWDFGFFLDKLSSSIFGIVIVFFSVGISISLILKFRLF